MKTLRETVLNLSSRSNNIDENLEVTKSLIILCAFHIILLINQQIISFLMALKDDRIRLSAAGLFNVGMDLVPVVNEL